jgi:hypothetical protein
MAKILYMVLGIFLSFSMVFTGMNGYSFMGFIESGRWSAKGKSTFHK